MKKRVQALAYIKKHVDQIKSPDLYIEQTIYKNITQIVSAAREGLRFKEQDIMIDFNPTSFGVHMQIDEDPTYGFMRFKYMSVPNWFRVNLRPPDFIVTPYVNNLQAFFHFNAGECQIVPANYAMNYRNCKMDIDRNIYFLKISCSSIEEAKRRAIVMAYLTYDMTRHLFVKLQTGLMLENPFNFNSIYETLELYGIEIETPDVDIKLVV